MTTSTDRLKQTIIVNNDKTPYIPGNDGADVNRWSTPTDRLTPPTNQLREEFEENWYQFHTDNPDHDLEMMFQWFLTKLTAAKQEGVEEERKSNYKNFNSWFKVPYRKGMKPVMVPPGLDKTKPQGGLVKLKGCEVCGGRLVYVRGQYPGGKRRKVCPTCAIEILEGLKSNLNSEVGQSKNQ